MRSRTAGLLLFFLILADGAQAAPVRLRCEAVRNPLGIDTPTPHFSWQSDSTERNWFQSAYQILAASSADRLQAGIADVWDSGKVKSGDSVGITYAGPKLDVRKRYYWTVRVWDASGHVSQSAETAYWETGLLNPEGWKAKWIAWKNPEEDADRAGIRWIWVAGQDALAMAPKTVAQFRLDVDVPEKPRDAALFVLARGSFAVKVNGRVVGSKSSWDEFDREDVTQSLKAGRNSIEIAVTVSQREDFGPEAGATMKAAVAALLKITRNDGNITRVATDGAWQGHMATDSGWQPAVVVGDLTDKRLGERLPGPLPQPAALLRHGFTVAQAVKSARLYTTALGSYQMFINGQRVGSDVLTPDFTDYTKRVLYQTYDVTGLLVSGQNAIGAILGDGWFGSALTWRGHAFFFLPPPTRLLAQLEIEYADGTRATIVSDETWKAGASPILYSEIYAGEFYDARLEQAGWSQADFDDGSWPSVVASGAEAPAIASQVSQPVRVSGTITPISVKALPGGAYVFDMGQNMVGWVVLKASGAPGTSIRLRFAEILNPDGTIYRENLRNADATDVYVLSGQGEETFRPHFTFHGFRYVEVTGYPGTPALAAITGEVINSLTGEPTGRLTTSSELVNRMWNIGLWGQRGNFLSIPTDCPQRDERLGWMGDAGVFWRTGTYNFDIEAFSHKFMDDVTDAQTAAGAFTNVAPDVLRPDGSEGAPGWGDAGVIIPWSTWLQYGDPSIIRTNWDAMQRWMEFIAKANPDFLRKQGVGPNFADWLAPDEHTPKDLLATAYWALIANMMAVMAHAVGKEDDATRYAELMEKIRKAYRAAYIKENGEVQGGTQTAYVVTLYTKMAPPALEAAMVDNLVKDIQSRNGHLSTGFLGTPFLLLTLANHGRADVAYGLLLNDTYPSWGYMLSKGATTWWERWNGDTGDPSMNSYNHYAFGSVVAWVYRSVAGIDTSVAGPGYREIVIHPHMDARITHARGEYDSAYGRIVSDWTGTPDGRFALEVSIPPNTRARVLLPASPHRRVMQDGKPVKTVKESGSQMMQLGSGSYHLELK